MYLIGTDEAGYGPNWGPLVISASVWKCETPDWSALSSNLNAHSISIGDSKKIYHGNNALGTLESGVLTFLQALGDLPNNLSELRRLTADTLTSDVPEFLVKIPYCVSRETIAQQAEVFKTILHSCAVELLAVKSKIITAVEFNRLLDKYPSEGAKATLLSNATLDLIAQCVSSFCQDDFVLVLGDKHGGRNRYLDMLMNVFPGDFFQTLKESREVSIYRRQDIEFRFLAKGETQLPIAASSMLSKYIRELAMKEFNGYWQQRIPGLKPTAGYPEDARRFLKEVTSSPDAARDIEPLWRKR